MRQFFLVASAALVLFACKKEDKLDKQGIFKGPVQELHHGKVWSWVKLNNQGNPEQLAIALDKKVLENVPEGDESHSGSDHTHPNSIFLALPSQALAVTPFKTLGVDWAPSGHPPLGIYDKPHFDFHYYMMTEAEVKAAVDPVALANEPAADYLPPMHLNVGAVPQMGQHWVDLTSPELAQQNPAPFTQTFIYGAYDGKINFYEPMATLSFLESTETFTRQIPQPAKYAQSGWYPTRISYVKENNGTMHVILDGFVYRQAS